MEKKEEKILINDISKDILKISIQMTPKDDSINHIYGPVNRGNWVCPTSPDGECRMILCKCCEEDGGYELKDDWSWFTGRCDKCDDTILLNTLALRFPLGKGGWIGCYCSIDCIENAHLDEDENIVFHIQGLISNLELFPMEHIIFTECSDDI